jgi:hypothetical protein
MTIMRISDPKFGSWKLLIQMIFFAEYDVYFF